MKGKPVLNLCPRVPKENEKMRSLHAAHPPWAAVPLLGWFLGHPRSRGLQEGRKALCLTLRDPAVRRTPARGAQNHNPASRKSSRLESSPQGWSQGGHFPVPSAQIAAPALSVSHVSRGARLRSQWALWGTRARADVGGRVTWGFLGDKATEGRSEEDREDPVPAETRAGKQNS